MTLDVIDLLRELDFSINEGSTRHSWLLRSSANEAFLVHPARPVERLTAHAIRHARTSQVREVRPLLIGRTATQGIMEQAKAGEIDILLEDPLQLILQGREFKAEEYEQPVPQWRPSRRPAWIRRAIERCLLLAEQPLHQPEIADLVGTSQQSVSIASKKLRPIVLTTVDGVEVNDRTALLEHWQKAYPGAGGHEFGWYSLDPIVEQTFNAFKIANLLEAAPLISGDVAADRLAPWKLPARGRIYVSSPIDLASYGFVSAPLDEATLVTCVPSDPTLWRLTEVGNFPVHNDVKLADPALVYWDVRNAQDIDSLEASNHLVPLLTGVSS